jgi:hypothetical protein
MSTLQQRASILAQNPPEEVSMREKNQQPIRQWRLPLHQDQIWTALPESARVSCRDLLVQLLVETFKPQPRRDDERQD